MKEKRVTKKAIFASLLSVAVCTSMLIGTSYAWFTDSVTSAGNKIKSGTLNIDLAVMDENGEYQSVKESQDPIFTYEKWEPGYTSWTNLKVTTTGNLALKYTLKFASKGDIKNAKLAEAIDVYYAPSKIAKAGRMTDAELVAAGFTKLGTLQEAFAGEAKFEMNDYLIPEAAAKKAADVDTDDEATLVLKMREEAGNEYQGLEIPDFDLNIFATQYTYEKDTFDDQYDKDAPAITVSDLDGLKAAIENVVDGGIVKLSADIALPGEESLVIDNGKQFTLDLGGKSIKGQYPIKLHSGDLTIANGKVDATAYGVDIQTATNTGVAKLTVAEDAEIAGDYAIINRQAKGDGVTCNNVIDIYGKSALVWNMGQIKKGNSIVNVYGTIEETNSDVALALAGAVTANVYGTVKCDLASDPGTAIEVRAGVLNVYDGAVIEGCGSPESFTPNGSGTTTVAAGIGVSQHTTKQKTEVNVYGGTIKSFVPLYQVNSQSSTDAELDLITINVTGGTFECTNGGTTQFSITNRDKIHYSNIYDN